MGEKDTVHVLWAGGPVLEDSADVYPISTDSVLLANFVNLSNVHRAADLGAGSGLIAILLAARSPELRIDCIELSHPAAAVCERNIRRNSLTARLTVLCRDLRTLRESEVGKYHLLVTNPPYYPPGTGTPPAGAARQLFREERGCTLPELAETAARLLGDGGRFAAVYPTTRLAEAIYTFQTAGLTPKRLRLVQADIFTPPSLALLECRRRGGTGLRVDPTLLLRDENGQDSAEVRRIYHREG